MDVISNLVTVTCPQHSETLTNGLWNSLTSQRGVDVDLWWCGQSLRAHRLILDVFLPLQHNEGVSASPDQHLHSALQHGTNVASHGPVLPSGTDEQPNDNDSHLIANLVLEFLYRGKVILNRERLANLLVVARQLNLQVLVDAILLTTNGDIVESSPTDCDVEMVEPKVVTGARTRAATLRGRKQMAVWSSSVESVEENDDSSSSVRTSCVRRLRNGRLNNSAATAVLVPKRQGRPRQSAQIGGSTDLPITPAQSDLPSSDNLTQSPPPPTRRRKKAILQKCDRCGYETVRRTQFRLHQATHDTSIQVFRCETCSRRFLSSELLAQHLLKHSIKQGEPAAAATATKQDRRALWRKKAVLQKCHCGYETMRRTQFQLHQATHDQSIQIFRCQTCSRRFLSPDLLARHDVKHSTIGQDKPTVDRRTLWRKKATLMQCEHCDFKTFRKSQYLLHAAKHDSSIRIYRCEKCVSSRFLSEEALEKHRAAHAGEPSIFECDKCDYKSPNNYWYQVHVSSHDPSTAVLKCSTCYRRFPSPEKLRRHKETSHTGEPEVYHCQFCKFASQNKRSYQQHLIIIHQVNSKGQIVPKRFKCDECDYSCVYGGELKYHVTTKHRTEKPYKCQLCPYASSRKGDVGQHIKAAHLNLKPHLCETCGQRCASQSSLDQHMRSHTGEKPFSCQTCTKKFSDRYSMKKHSRLHTSNERPFVCHVCGNAFNRRDNLKVHLRNVHKTLMEPDSLKLGPS